MLSLRSFNKALVRYFSNHEGYSVSDSSQLQVVSTNQWPIPYYKRMHEYPMSLYPETDYNISHEGNHSSKPNDYHAYRTQITLLKTMRGREILQYMNNIGRKGDLLTTVESPAMCANVYTDDLLRHIDFTRKENARILKKHNFAEVFQ